MSFESRLSRMRGCGLIGCLPFSGELWVGAGIWLLSVVRLGRGRRQNVGKCNAARAGTFEVVV